MKHIVLAAALLFLLAACSKVEVRDTYNPDTDFSALKTYAWLSDIDHPSDNVRINNEMVRESVREGIEEALNARGFVKVKRESADFLVTWFGAIEKRLKAESIEHFYAPYGYGTLYRDPYWNSKPGVANVTEYEEGQIIVDILDPARQTLIWRGTGNGKITPGLPEPTRRKNLKKAVAAIMAPFPPQ